MAEKPILFSGPMILANNEGRKTNTRRILKIKGHRSFSEFGPSETPGFEWHFRDAEMRWHDLTHDELLPRLKYQIGDRLWVRETWRPQGGYSNWDVLVNYGADGEKRHFADGEYDSEWNFPKAAYKGNVPSIFMPRWASRTTLIVTDVQVERLQDITEKDATAEGLEHRMDWLPQWRGGEGLPWRSEFPRDAFEDLWDSINAKRGFGWATNPWVAAYTYTVHPCNIDEMSEVDG